MQLSIRVVYVAALLALPAQAALNVEFGGTFGLEADASAFNETLIIERPESSFAVDVHAVLTEGSGVLRIVDPSGVEIYRHLWGERLSEELAPLGPLVAAGEYRIVIEAEGAVGGWRMRIVELPEASTLKTIYLVGPLLGVVGLAFLLGWRFGTKSAWRWFAAGAIARVAAALLALALVLAYHFTLRAPFEESLSYSRYLVVDSGAMGIAAGIAAVMAFLVTGFALRGSRASAANGIAVGVGAGAGETLVSSVVTIVGAGLLFGGSPKSEKWMLQLAYDSALTPLLPLVEPVKFACVIMCLMATSGLCMMAIATRRWGLLAGAFLLLAGFYTAIGASRVWTLHGASSKWWALCGALPFAAISVVAVRRFLRDWPPVVAPNEAPMEAFLRDATAAGKGPLER